MLKYIGTEKNLLELDFIKRKENFYELVHVERDEYNCKDYGTISIIDNECKLLAYDNGHENPQVLTSIMKVFMYMVKCSYIIWED